MTRGPVVIVGCGAAKLSHPAPAAELYTGQHYRACMATARALAPAASIRILSARHGLLRLSDQVAPYDLTIGQPGAVTPSQVAAQAAAAGLSRSPVVALCSARYVTLLRAAGLQVAAPLAGQGIGRQRATLARIRTGARLACGCLPNSAEAHAAACPLGGAA